MRTNIDLDESLVREALKLTKSKTKRELVDLALKELVEHRRRKDLRELFGKISFFPGYDYKALRRGRS